MSTRTRGRPPLAWLTADQLDDLTPGTAVSVETLGKHTARLVGRVLTRTDTHIDLATPSGVVELDRIRIRRARVVDALYQPGDPVLLRGVHASRWRGGVVRCAGTDVLVEQIDGTFVWHSEDDLEPADAREQKNRPSTRARA